VKDLLQLASVHTNFWVLLIEVAATDNDVVWLGIAGSGARVEEIVACDNALNMSGVLWSAVVVEV
jgi:hypothetical protein